MKRALVALLAVLALAGCKAPEVEEPVKAGVHVTKAHWVEPYGGCDEAWRYPGTPGYRQCVRHVLSQDLLPTGGGWAW